jgi:Domain of unknown function (DUF4411)
MAPKPIHWVDANVLITAAAGPFRFSINPGFWSFVDEQITIGTIRSPKMVYEEIVSNLEGTDALVKWTRNRRQSGFFVASTSAAVQMEVRRIANHVIAHHPQRHAAEFLRGADPWLIAHAIESKGIVVTFETHQVGALRVKIPNVCDVFGVKCSNPYDMLENLKAEFAVVKKKS